MSAQLEGGHPFRASLAMGCADDRAAIVRIFGGDAAPSSPPSLENATRGVASPPPPCSQELVGLRPPYSSSNGWRHLGRTYAQQCVRHDASASRVKNEEEDERAAVVRRPGFSDGKRFGRPVYAMDARFLRYRAVSDYSSRRPYGRNIGVWRFKSTKRAGMLLRRCSRKEVA